MPSLRAGSEGRLRSATALERFNAKVLVVGDCWLWTGHVNAYGYGRLYTDGKRLAAHRWSYEHFVGLIPPGLTIDHTCHSFDPSCPGGRCDHRRCVRPDHLEPVPSGVNVLRGRTLSGRNASKTHCDRGHPLFGDNLKVLRSGDRRCRTCAAARDSARPRERLGTQRRSRYALRTAEQVERDRERGRETTRRYRERHPDRIRAYIATNRLRAQSLASARRRERYATDPEYADRIRARERERYALKKQAA